MAARTSDPQATKASILAAARLQFGAHGFERTTIRSVAGAAGVDPALVMHYFRTKNGLFAEASRLDVAMPDLTGVRAADVAAILIPTFETMWSPPDGPLLPLLRAAASNQAAASAALVDVFTHQVAPALSAVVADRPAERAALIGSHLLGIAVGRHIVGIAALADMPDEALIAWLAPAIAHYLTGPAPALS